MTLPGDHIFSLLLLVFGMLCWGLWANTIKAVGKWRYELFYFDFALGVFLSALIAAFTLGSLGQDGFSVADDLQLAGKRQELYAFIAGSLFNLANMLIVGAVSVSGMAVAFPVGLGSALVLGVGLNCVLHPLGNPYFLALGCGAVLAAILLDAQAWKAYASRKSRLAEEASPATDVPSTIKFRQPRGKRTSPKKSRSSKALIVALAGGILMSFVYPFVDLARRGDNALGPYSTALVFAIGVLSTTFVYSLFFMNLPVHGEPLDFSDYFRGKRRQHALGLIGGILWSTGIVSSLVADQAQGPASVAPSVGYALRQASMLISALCGLIVWKEFASADSDARAYVSITLVLLGVGIAFVSFATA